jgi:hypothetical protein
MREYKPKLTREQCLFSVRHQMTPGQIMAQSGIYLTDRDVIDAMIYHRIPYSAKTTNHGINRRPKEGDRYDGQHKTQVSSRIIKVGTHRLRGGLHGS